MKLGSTISSTKIASLAYSRMGNRFESPPWPTLHGRSQMLTEILFFYDSSIPTFLQNIFEITVLIRNNNRNEHIFES